LWIRFVNQIKICWIELLLVFFAFRTNWSFDDDDDLICVHSFYKLLEISKERLINFDLGIGKMPFYLKKRFMKFWTWNGVGKNLENGIYEFWKWN